MKPIDLKAKFGRKWQVSLDESASGCWADPWNYIIPCRHGHLYPAGGDYLGAATNRSGAIVRELKAIDGVEVVADGSDGANVIFREKKLSAVQRVMKPLEVRRLSPAQRAALARDDPPNDPLQ
jgi:hypothetical protein